MTHAPTSSCRTDAQAGRPGGGASSPVPGDWLAAEMDPGLPIDEAARRVWALGLRDVDALERMAEWNRRRPNPDMMYPLMAALEAAGTPDGPRWQWGPYPYASARRAWEEDQRKKKAGMNAQAGRGSAAEGLHAMNGNSAGQGGPAAPAWLAMALTPIVLDGPQPPPPELVRGLFYRRGRHLLYGPPEAYKSMLALATLRDVLHEDAAAYVVFIDYEKPRRVLVERLRVLGFTADEARRVIHVASPGSLLDLNSTDAAALRMILSRFPVRAVVIDAFTGALSSCRLVDRDGAEVDRWWREVGDPLCGEERLLLVIDHVTKEGAGLNGPIDFPKESARKKEGADVALCMKPFGCMLRRGLGKGTRCGAKVWVTKDSEGWLPAVGKNRVLAEVWFVVGDEDLLSLEVAAPDGDGDGQGGVFRPTAIMENISQFIERANGQTVNKGEIEKEHGLGGDARLRRMARDLLVSEGYLEPLPRAGNAHPLQLRKPYREANDPLSSRRGLVSSETRGQVSSVSSGGFSPDETDEDKIEKTPWE